MGPNPISSSKGYGSPNRGSRILTNGIQYSKVFSGTTPEFIDGDVFKVIITLNGLSNDGVNDGVKLSETERAVLDCIKKDNVASATKIAETIGKNKRTVERALKALKEKKRIERVGSDKNGGWKILI